MRIRIQKWGNSLALRLPKPFVEEIRVKQGATVELSVEGGKITLTPLIKTKYTLKKLLDGVTEKNLHNESDFGGPLGQEVW